MKRNILSGLVIGVALFVGSFACDAATVTAVIDGAAWGTGNSLLGAPCNINSITIANSSTTNTLVTFIDSWTNKLTYTRGSYTYISQAATAMPVYIWTNSAGVVQSNTYVTNFTAIYTTTNTVAASTNNFPALLSVVVPASTTATYTNTGVVYWGLTVATNTEGPVTVTVNYSSFK